MRVLVTYDDGIQVVVEEDTWLEVINQVGCTAMSLVVISDCMKT